MKSLKSVEARLMEVSLRRAHKAQNVQARFATVCKILGIPVKDFKFISNHRGQSAHYTVSKTVGRQKMKLLAAHPDFEYDQDYKAYTSAKLNVLVDLDGATYSDDPKAIEIRILFG